MVLLYERHIARAILTAKPSFSLGKMAAFSELATGAAITAATKTRVKRLKVNFMMFGMSSSSTSGVYLLTVGISEHEEEHYIRIWLPFGPTITADLIPLIIIAPCIDNSIQHGVCLVDDHVISDHSCRYLWHLQGQDVTEGYEA